MNNCYCTLHHSSEKYLVDVTVSSTWNNWQSKKKCLFQHTQIVLFSMQSKVLCVNNAIKIASIVKRYFVIKMWETVDVLFLGITSSDNYKRIIGTIRFVNWSNCALVLFNDFLTITNSMGNYIEFSWIYLKHQKQHDYKSSG